MILKKYIFLDMQINFFMQVNMQINIGQEEIKNLKIQFCWLTSRKGTFN